MHAVRAFSIAPTIASVADLSVRSLVGGSSGCALLTTVWFATSDGNAIYTGRL